MDNVLTRPPATTPTTAPGAIPDARPPASPLRLRLQVSLGVAFAVLLAALLSGWLATRSMGEELTRHSGELLREMAAGMRDTLDREMEQHYEQVRLFAGLDELLRPELDPSAARKLLDQVHDSFPQFAWIGLTDREGKVLASSGGLLESNNVAQRPWFKGAVDGPFVGDVHPAVLLEKLLPRQQEPWRFVDVAIPITDTDGKVFRVLGSHLSWAWARDLRRTIQASSQGGRTAEVLVVSKDGNIILGPAGEEGKHVDLAPYRPTAAGTAGYVAAAQPGARLTAYAETRGRGRYPGLGWVVLVREPAAGTPAAILGQLREQLLLGALLLAALASVVAWFGVRAVHGRVAPAAA